MRAEWGETLWTFLAALVVVGCLWYRQARPEPPLPVIVAANECLP